MLRNLFDSIYFKRTKLRIYLGEKKKIKKRKKLIQKCTLTEEQKNQIDNIWLKNYGKKIPYDWHRLYTSYTGVFNAQYFPEIFFTTNLLNKLNPPNRKRYLENKILLQYYFNNIDNGKLAKNYIYNCSGYFYDKNGIISYNQAINKIKNIGEVIIKPSLDSDSGNNVRILNIKGGRDIITNEKIENILKKYNENYIIQEKIIQHETFAKLNPSSVNTIRVHTYICDGKIYCSPMTMRIGRNGSMVDNLHAGGIAVEVKENGNLGKYGFTLEDGEKFDKHPDTNVKFGEYKIPKIKEMIELIKKYHYRIPHIGDIGWDLTLDINENIIIIETNIICPGTDLIQFASGKSLFGNNTEKMIRMLKDKDKEIS